MIFKNGTPMSRLSRKKKIILIVDDDKEYCDLQAELIERMGHTPVAVNDGASALQWLDRQEFALALIDYHMPVMTGAELLKTMREKKIHTPVIIITGLEDEKMEEKLRKLEVTNILKKPLQMDLFESTIRHWLEDS